jgi:hypothetical protein
MGGFFVATAGENNVNGFGLEFFIETPADEIGSSLTDIKKSWQFQLLYTVSQLAAGCAATRDMQLPLHPWLMWDWRHSVCFTSCLPMFTPLSAGHGGISNIIDDMQLLSTEAEGVNEAIPEDRRKALVNRAGRVGALLGLTDTRIGAPDCKYSSSLLVNCCGWIWA